MAHPSPRQSELNAAAAFARGDFAQVRALAPSFVATANTGPPPLALFAPNRLLWAAAGGALATIAGAWGYALMAG